MRASFDAAAALMLAFGILSSPLIADGEPVLEIDVPKAKAPLSVDGEMKQGEWDGAAVIAGLKPSRGASCQDRIDRIPTRISLLWDEDFLYVAFVNRDSAIFCEKTERDGDLYLEDVDEIFIDPTGDGKQYLEIQVNPRNAVLDMLYLLTAEPQYTDGMRFTQDFYGKDVWTFREWSLNGLKTATRIFEEDGKPAGWTAEIAIPAWILGKRKGMKKLAPTALRANFIRYDWPLGPSGKRELLHMNWAPVLHGCPHISPAAMGRLVLKP